MEFAVFILFLYLVGSAQVQTKENYSASSKCPAPKQIARYGDGFAVQLNQPNIVYIYVAKSNSFLVLNVELNWAVILYGTQKTIFSGDANIGFGGIFNSKTDLLYAITENRTPFNISKVLEGDFSIAANLIDYTSIYIDKVIGSDIDTTQPEYSNTSTLLQDYATTTDYSKWVSYRNGTKTNSVYIESNIKITKAINKVFRSNEGYTVEWGAIMFYVVASEEYKKEEKCQTAFIDVPMKLVREHDFKLNSKLMNELYNVVSAQKNMTKEVAIQRYEAILNME